MPVSLSDEFKAELLREPSRLAQFCRIDLRDGTTIGLTNFYRSLTDPETGIVYRASGGFGPSATQSQRQVSEGDNGTGAVFFDDDELTPQRIEGGLLDGARFEHFIACYEDLSLGKLVKNKGFLSNLEIGTVNFRLNFNGVEKILSQTVLDTTGPNCRYVLGDEFCGVNLNGNTVAGHAISFSGPVSSVGDNSAIALDSRRTFICSGLTSYPQGHFAVGRIKFTSGPNAPFGWFPIEKFAADSDDLGAPGQFQLALRLPFEISVGDEFTAVAGCDKQMKGDCKNKFNNVPRFGGEPGIPGEKLYDKEDSESFI